MLFSIKNRLVPTLCLLLALIAGCLAARAGLHLAWRIKPYPGFMGDTALGLAAVLASDALVHGALTRMFGDRYRSATARSRVFPPPGPVGDRRRSTAGRRRRAVLPRRAPGGLMNRAALGAGVGLESPPWHSRAALASRRAPGTVHLLGLWEGVVLGCLYLVLGSLLVSIIVHIAHDLIGFTLFARERQLAATRDVLEPRFSETAH